MIAQSQQRIEQGQVLQESPRAEIPSFSASSSARWINGLWFTALAMSISAALIGLLAKEWLTAFTSARPRPAHTYSVLRQSRVEGLARWRALHIIHLLPSLLHLALLLFSLGLVVYLWTLDKGIASVIMAITSATLIFYISTSILGAIYEFCPFVTQISIYFRNLVSTPTSNRRLYQIDLGDSALHAKTTERELRALKWLAENARDPSIGDCAYQALAGLAIPSSESTSTSKDSIQQYIILSSMFSIVSERLSKALRFQPQKLSACHGMNAARYAAALPKMLRYLETYTGPRPSISEDQKGTGVPSVRAQDKAVLLC